MTFRFANSWILLLAVLVPLLLAARYLLTKQQMRPATMKYAAARLAKIAPSTWRVTWRPILIVMRIAAIVLILIGLARPQIVQGKETIKGEGVEIALALDISGSMASLDFEPNNRLEAAKEVIGDFVTERPYDKLGLVIFSSEAFNQSPLTLDHRLLTRSLDQVELATDLGIDDGTAIGLGIANAANMLSSSDAESKVIVLLTDGVNNAGQIDPLTAAEAAKALGIKVYTIGAAKPGQVPVPVQSLFGGTQISYQESVLDEQTLQQVADTTGGKYYRAEDTAGLKAIYDEINELEKSQVEVQVFNQYHELFAFLLIPALLILALETILRNTAFVTLP
ncbi:MAG: vWA domain-containing protein [Candidatus Promineifilaceae bacterium]|jgi:Ca-activated chloride channel family protein